MYFQKKYGIILIRKQRTQWVITMITDLNEKIIENVKKDSIPMVVEALGDDLDDVILYGSCARGDFSVDSDVDIALITSCNRIEVKKYTKTLASIAAEMTTRYMAIVNFVCLPKAEFEEKRSWYPYFRNIDKEGIVLYGRKI